MYSSGLDFVIWPSRKLETLRDESSPSATRVDARAEPVDPGQAAEAADHGPVAQLAWTIAAVALGYAVQIGDGHLHLDAMWWLSAALILTLAVVIAPRTLHVGRRSETLVIAGLVVALAFQFWQLLQRTPGIYLTDSHDRALEPFRHGILLVAVLSGALAGIDRWQWRVSVMGLVLAVHFALGVWLIQASPKPFIDTFVFQRDAVDALLSFRNPYRLQYPNIYPDESNYGPGLFVNNRSRFGYPYPPLCLLFATVGKLVGGDFRYSQLIAMTLSGGLIAALGKLHRIPMLAATLFLFTPRGFFVLEQSWTEPYLVCLFAAVVLSARRASKATPWVTGLLLVAKQHAVFLLPLLWLLPKAAGVRNRRPFFAKAAAIGAVVTLPWFLIRPMPFIRSVALFQFRQPFRPDALSYMALGSLLGWGLVPQYSVFIAALAGIGLALWRSPRTTAGFCGAAALMYFGFFAIAKQAFANYYYFEIGLLCCAIAAASPQLGRIARG